MYAAVPTKAWACQAQVDRLAALGFQPEEVFVIDDGGGYNDPEAAQDADRPCPHMGDPPQAGPVAQVRLAVEEGVAAAPAGAQAPGPPCGPCKGRGYTGWREVCRPACTR